jgi:hypothetical protein
MLSSFFIGLCWQLIKINVKVNNKVKILHGSQYFQIIFEKVNPNIAYEVIFANWAQIFGSFSYFLFNYFRSWAGYPDDDSSIFAS